MQKPITDLRRYTSTSASLTGQMHICQNLKILGVDRNGCFAEYIAVPELVLWRNDSRIPFELAAAQEPLGNAVYCTLVEPVTARTVLIYGDGPVGLFATGVAKAAGASKVYLAGLSPYRLEIGRKMGADVLFIPGRDKVEERVLDETGGTGVDIVLDLVGKQSVLDQGLKFQTKQNYSKHRVNKFPGYHRYRFLQHP